MDELESLKRKRLKELQNRQQESTDEHQQIQQELEQLENIVKQAFTKEALSRFGNLKSAHPQKAIHLLIVLGQAIQAGKIKTINDSQLKDILIKLTPEKKETKITRL